MRDMVAVLRSLFVVLIATMPWYTPAAGAQDNYPPPVVPESAKLVLVQSILQDENTRVFLVAPETETAEQRIWCERFLAGFESGAAVTFVEPVARSDLYDDPAFGPWHKQCPALAMNSSIGPSPLMLYEDHPELPSHMPDGQLLAGYQYGTKNFKLYRTDIDNNPENGEETVFYSERAYSYWEAVVTMPGLAMALPPIDRDWNETLPPDEVPAMPSYWGSHYKLLRSTPCLADELLRTEDPYDDTAKLPQSSYNGIINYDEKSYLVSFERKPMEDSLQLNLVEVVRFGRGTPKVKTICTYR